MIRVEIASSFGRNPVSGGIPASEHKRISRIKCVCLFFWSIIICVVDFILDNIIRMKIGVTVVIYSVKYTMHIVGVSDRIIIHPRCLTDE